MKVGDAESPQFVVIQQVHAPSSAHGRGGRGGTGTSGYHVGANSVGRSQFRTRDLGGGANEAWRVVDATNPSNVPP